MKKRFILILVVFIGLLTLFFLNNKSNLNPIYTVGQPLDSLNGVVVYYNGGVDHVAGRRVTKDGHNLGLKFQCVEFVKRYYYEELNHQMPESYGHAKDFFNPQLKDGGLNKQRNLFQFNNPSSAKPKPNDLVVYSSTPYNDYGHVSIISRVSEDQIEIIQQNPGPFSKSREEYQLIYESGKWKINNERIKGWLRK